MKTDGSNTQGASNPVPGLLCSPQPSLFRGQSYFPQESFLHFQAQNAQFHGTNTRGHHMSPEVQKNNTITLWFEE